MHEASHVISKYTDSNTQSESTPKPKQSHIPTYTKATRPHITVPKQSNDTQSRIANTIPIHIDCTSRPSELKLCSQQPPPLPLSPEPSTLKPQPDNKLSVIDDTSSTAISPSKYRTKEIISESSEILNECQKETYDLKIPKRFSRSLSIPNNTTYSKNDSGFDRDPTSIPVIRRYSYNVTDIKSNESPLSSQPTDAGATDSKIINEERGYDGGVEFKVERYTNTTSSNTDTASLVKRGNIPIVYESIQKNHVQTNRGISPTIKNLSRSFTSNIPRFTAPRNLSNPTITTKVSTLVSSIQQPTTPIQSMSSPSSSNHTSNRRPSSDKVSPPILPCEIDYSNVNNRISTPPPTSSVFKSSSRTSTISSPVLTNHSTPSISTLANPLMKYNSTSDATTHILVNDVVIEDGISSSPNTSVDQFFLSPTSNSSSQICPSDATVNTTVNSTTTITSPTLACSPATSPVITITAAKEPADVTVVTQPLRTSYEVYRKDSCSGDYVLHSDTSASGTASPSSTASSTSYVVSSVNSDCSDHVSSDSTRSRSREAVLEGAAFVGTCATSLVGSREVVCDNVLRERSDYLRTLAIGGRFSGIIPDKKVIVENSYNSSIKRKLDCSSSSNIGNIGKCSPSDKSKQAPDNAKLTKLNSSDIIITDYPPTSIPPTHSHILNTDHIATYNRCTSPTLAGYPNIVYRSRSTKSHKSTKSPVNCTSHVTTKMVDTTKPTSITLQTHATKEDVSLTRPPNATTHTISTLLETESPDSGYPSDTPILPIGPSCSLDSTPRPTPSSSCSAPSDTSSCVSDSSLELLSAELGYMTPVHTRTPRKSYGRLQHPQRPQSTIPGYTPLHERLARDRSPLPANLSKMKGTPSMYWYTAKDGNVLII